MDAQLPASRSLVPEPGLPQVPDHRLISLIGGGSYGQIWLAQNIMGAYRAVKVVSRSKFQSERPYEREFEGLQRFEPISRSHEGFLQILHIGRNDDEGYFYYVMELGESADPEWKTDPSRYSARTLATEMDKRGRLPLDRCLEIALALSEACARLHQQGLVHRDLKPANLVFVNDRPKLADIGLVTDAGPGATFVGTEGYVPKEGPGLPTADIYALGKILYEMSTGRSCEDYPQLPDELPPSCGAVTFAELNTILCKCCEEDPELRYQSAEELRLHLSLLRAGTSVRRLIRLGRFLGVIQRQALPILLGFVALGAVGFSVWRGYRHALELKRSEAELVQRKVGGFLASGNQSMDKGDYTASLPWFAAALALSDKDPQLAETHRTRMAAVLHRSPRIVRLWTSNREARSAQFAEDPDLVLVQGSEGHFQLSRISTGQSEFPAFGSEHGEEAVCMERRAEFALTSSRKETVARLWEIRTGRLVRELRFPNYLTVARLSLNGDRVAAGLIDGGVVVQSLAGGRQLVLQGHLPGKRVLHVAFNASGTKLVSTSEDGLAVVWDVTTGTKITQFAAHRNWVNWGAFSPDGTLVATAGFDGFTRIWNASTAQPVREIEVPPNQVVRTIEFTADGQRLVTSDFDFSVRTWDLNGREVGVPLHHGEHVVFAAASLDGQRILSVTQDGTTRVWQLPQPLQNQAITRVGDYQPKSAALLTQVGSNVVWSGIGASNRSRPWSLASFGLVRGYRLSTSGDRAVVMSETVRSSSDEIVTLSGINAMDGRRLGPEFQVASGVRGMELPGSGGRVLLWWTHAVEVWDLDRGEKRWRFEIPGSRVGTVAVDRGLSQVAVAVSGDDGSRVHMIDGATGQPFATPPLAHPSSIRAMAFSPSGETLASACQTPMARAEAAFLWETRTGKLQAPPLYHRDGVLHVAFSPDGHRLVTSGEDRNAMVWDSATGRPLLRPLAHRDQVIQSVFNAKGNWVVTLTSSSGIRVWDAATGDPVTPEFASKETLSSVAFSSDSSVVVGWTRGDLQSHLGTLVTIPLDRESRPAADLSAISKVLSGRSYDLSGGLVPARSADLLKTWEALRQSYPSEFSAADLSGQPR